MTEASEPQFDGIIWESGTPLWLRVAPGLLVMVAATACQAIIGLSVGQPLLETLERLPFAIIWAPLLLIGTLVSPLLLLRVSERTWLRKYYPDAAALAWNAEGIHLADGRMIPWANARYCLSIRGDLHLVFEASGIKETLEIAKARLLSPNSTIEALNAAIRENWGKARSAQISDETRRHFAAASATVRELYGKTQSQLRAEGIDVSSSEAAYDYARANLEQGLNKPT